MPEDCFSEFESKLRAAGASKPAIAAFHHNYSRLVSGATGMIPESQIEPVRNLPDYGAIGATSDSSLLAETIIVKLNGGLGTGMGLERAKSLLKVKEDCSFLDLIARQILHLRARHRSGLRFVLMNSFNTSRDTFEALRAYPHLGDPLEIELMQSQVPKVDAATFRPVSWPENPRLEWCPPGHGDFYTSLFANGMLSRLLEQGVRYAFISNSDNLGATLDLPLLTWFARSEAPFLMEVAERTASDRKGGHLAARHGSLILRESAQCPDEDSEAFQDVQKHRFFNTNNLWVRLDHLKPMLDGHGGFLPLPLIHNSKTVDPRRKDSTKVAQLETAMGAAIECFETAAAVVVPRTRFAPVKTTSDLMALRSDAYRLTEDWRMVLSKGGAAIPPSIDLDPDRYKMMDGFERLVEKGVPSLADCEELVVRGPMRFGSGVVCRGRVRIENNFKEEITVAPGVYEG
jgi:UDP-N-acetylglucosamine pyrophosphorylase